ncbi:transketolase family protein [Desulfospira joergensenii]|uniref:transketolase family protein n=1 Tax=Desulfospira joergensenii TaxID=53329 RepID=UPI0003B67E61|nr:transketolase C-terminal domain-containing protein [Desulfospira joergensenii]
MMSTRESFGIELVNCGKNDNNFVVFDADVAGATCTDLFAKKFPKRFFQFGVAEQNMVGAAAGFASTGIPVVAATFGVFLSMRAIEQYRTLIAYSNLPVVLIGSHSGADAGPDGVTHQAIEDIAIFRSIPNTIVLQPADEREMKYLLAEAISLKKPVYMRTIRSKTETLSGRNSRIGQGQVLKKGKDLTIVASGIMVQRAMEAANILGKKNIDIEVINISTIKPIDKELILASIKKTNRVITAEDHNVINGLGAAVSETVTSQYPVKQYRIGINDRFTESGDPNDLAAKYELDVKAIVSMINQMVKE